MPDDRYRVKATHNGNVVDPLTPCAGCGKDHARPDLAWRCGVRYEVAYPLIITACSGEPGYVTIPY